MADFNFRSSIGLSQTVPKSVSYTFREYSFNYTIGQYHRGGIELNFKPTDKLSITLAGYAVQYNILHSRYNDIVFNFDVAYQFNNWLQASVYGQYSAKGIQNARNGGYMFSPQTYYGAMLDFKTSEKVSINIGVERTLNPFTKGWDTNSILAPKIRFR